MEDKKGPACALVLRSASSPVLHTPEPAPRDQAAERRRALVRSKSTLAAAKPRRERRLTPAGYREETEEFRQLSALPVLKVVPRPTAKAQEPKETRQRRLAALSRWHKVAVQRALEGSSEEPAPAAVRQLLPAADEARAWRRGESERDVGKYRDYTNEELYKWCMKLKNHELKWPEYERLYDAGKTKVPPPTCKMYVYSYKKHLLATLLTDGLSKFGPKHGLLTTEQENYITGLSVELAFQHRSLAPVEIMAWAKLAAVKNDTKDEDSVDVRAWYSGWKGRMKKLHDIDLEEHETEQLSKQRAAVNLSDLRAFQETVNTLLNEHPEVKSRRLQATGDWDESKIDLNALVQDCGLVPEGMLAQWEVEGEWSAQITMLGGFMGYRRTESDLPRSLKDMRARIAKAKEGQLDDVLSEELSKIGSIAGYPKLEPGVWDGDDFCVLPQLLIFEGKTSADPAWLNEAHDRTRTMVATTESGFINTELKYEWYRRCKQLEHCPFGKRPSIPQADSHASNESVEMSAEMELEDEAYLIAPPGHSYHAHHPAARPDRRPHSDTAFSINPTTPYGSLSS